MEIPALPSAWKLQKDLLKTLARSPSSMMYIWIDARLMYKGQVTGSSNKIPELGARV